jgi:uncharacterized protein YcbK (DUF882 family)
MSAPPMRWRRREFLIAGGRLAGAAAAGLGLGTARSRAAAPASDAARGGEAPKRIALENLHTRERLDIEYYREGAYVPEALSAIEVLLRDFRTGERHAIDPNLMDYLVQVAQTVGVDPAFSVISGYRSPATNARLREQSTGVAQRSLHMEGRAIDVRMSRVDCATLAARAQDLRRGGVGYYRTSDFVHLDTGAFRTWKG